MRQLVVCLALLAAFIIVSGASFTGALAQDKSKGPYIEVSEGKDGKYRFSVRSGEGKLLAMSGPTGYADEKAALKAIDDLKTALKTAKVISARKAKK